MTLLTSLSILFSLPSFGQQSVDPYFGSFGTSVPITVPKFHGLEPGIQLVYNSGGGNGQLGLGWGLTGFSSIERASASHGAPAYDGNDSNSLDGQWLLPCDDGSTSPGCLAGGTHSTQTENYNRIKFIADTNQWETWDKNGTHSVYSPVFSPNRLSCPVETYELSKLKFGSCPAIGSASCGAGWSVGSSTCYRRDFDSDARKYEWERIITCARSVTSCAAPSVGGQIGTFRWGLSSVSDTHNNRVDYTWQCDGANDCYPKTVTYNGTAVTMYWEPRPDPISFATGSGMGNTNWRMKSIDVSVSGSHVRGYRLAYQDLASTRSTLAAVYQYGSDVVFDGSGTIVGGGALLPMTMTTAGRTPGFDAYVLSGILSGGFDTAPHYGSLRNADVNGDGKFDICARDEAGIGCWLALGNGAFSTTRIAGPSWSSADGWDNSQYNSTIQFADVNGDGKSDVCGRSSTEMRCYLFDGAGVTSSIAGPAWSDAAGWSSPASYGTIRLADVNGDGKADICGRDPAKGNVCWLSNGAGFPTMIQGPPVDSPTHSSSIVYVDVNGDRNADFCIQQDAAPTCWLSSGAGFPTQIDGPREAAGLAGLGYPDLNGDGKADLCGLDYTAGLKCFLSDGRGIQTPFAQISEMSGMNWGWAPRYYNSIRYPDLNGDGRADVCGRNADGVSCWLTTSNGFSRPITVGLTDESGWNDDQYASTIAYADVTGDGLPDLCARGASGMFCYTLTGSAELLQTLSNGVGGTTSIQYTPSSAWSNTYLPVGMVFPTASSMTTSDGRGASGSTQYAFSGGLWSSAERRFLGFGKVKAVIDVQGNTTETYYHQHAGCISKPSDTYFRASNGHIYSYTHYDYSESATAPFTSLLAERWDFECDGTSSVKETAVCRKVVTQLGYDVYGDVTETIEQGDVTVTGDERVTRRGYYPNPTAYIVSKPAYENVFDGAGKLLTQALWLYDGNSTYGAVPHVGDATRKYVWNNSTGDYSAFQWAYDAYGNQVQQIDPTGVTTWTTMDPTYHQFTTQQCNALGHCMSQEWTYGLGEPTSRTDANGISTTTTYDLFGRVTSRARSDGNWVTLSYLNWGDPASQRIHQAVSDGTADGLVSDQYQDGLGRIWKVSREGGISQETLFSDTSTRAWMVSEPHFAWETPVYTTYAYDYAGRRVRETHPDQSSSTISYGIGYAFTSDELEHWKLERRDAFGRITQVVQRATSAYSLIDYTYDGVGNIIKTVDGAGNTNTAWFDSLGRARSQCDVDRGCSAMSYDAAGRITSRTNGNGQTLTWAYDSVGRMIAKNYPDGSQVVWTYDEAGHGAGVGRITSVSDPSGSESLTYAPNGLPSSTTKCIQGLCKNLSTTYDLMDRARGMTFGDGETISYEYDSIGNLVSVPGYLSSASYNSRGQMLQATYANGTSESFSYDGNRDWLNTAQVDGPQGPLYQANYTYDLAANVKTWTSSIDSAINFAYSYDEINRLVSVTGAANESFSYDTIGNMTSQNGAPYAYGDSSHVHAVTSARGSTYSYDRGGNMLTRDNTSFAWNADDMLGTISTPSSTLQLSYDSNGQRVYKSSASGETRYFGKQFEIAPNQVETNFIYAGPRLIAKNSGNGKFWFHQDHLGSVRLLTNVNGEVADRFAFTAYGTSASLQVSEPNARSFTGHELDAETGLTYMGSRYYDSQLGRFISADSIVPATYNPQAFNRYSYCYNSPISNIDPTGHVPVALAFVSALAAGGTELAWLAWTAFAVTSVGYVTHDATLMSIGMILGGAASGGATLNWGAAARAAVLSPVSPLNPKIKEAVGWAVSAYGMYEYQASELAKSDSSKWSQNDEWPSFEYAKPGSDDNWEFVNVNGTAFAAAPPAFAANAPGSVPIDPGGVLYGKVYGDVRIFTFKYTFDIGVVSDGVRWSTFFTTGMGRGNGALGVGFGVMPGAQSLCDYGGLFTTFSVPGPHPLLGIDVFHDPTQSLSVPATWGGGVTLGWSGKALPGLGLTVSNTMVKGCGP